MRNYKIDEASERQPQVLQVNSESVRLYFDHKEEERDDMEGNKQKVYVAKYAEFPLSMGATAEELARNAVLAEIEAYDTSDAVNSFLLNEKEEWLDKTSRIVLTHRASVAKAAGYESTTLWFGTTALETNCDKALQLLNDLELYASTCYDTTAAHKKAVSELEKVEDLVAYDYTTGYPEKLTMTV